MRTLIVGAGATGSVLAARFVAAGVPVDLVGRPAAVAAIRSHGLVVEGLPGGPFEVPVRTTVPVGEYYDRILLAVKAWDIGRAAETIARSLPHPTPLLALQNGLGIRARVIEGYRVGGWAFADRWVTRGIQLSAATLLGPGRVRLVDPGEILLGPSGLSGGLNGFDALLARARIRVRTVPSIEREEWRKALVNAAVNPVTADHAIENGRLVQDPWRGQALALLDEARRAADAEGFEFSADLAERELFRVVRATAANRSSMLQDLDRGRPTEIDAISGAILRAGARHGLDLPNTRRIVARIRARVARAGPRPARAPARAAKTK